MNNALSYRQRRATSLWACMMLVCTLSSSVVSADDEWGEAGNQERIFKDKHSRDLYRRTRAPLELVCEDVGLYYKDVDGLRLQAFVMDALQKEVMDAKAGRPFVQKMLNTINARRDGSSLESGVVPMLVARPAFKAAFREVMSQRQLREYAGMAAERGLRYRRALVRYAVTWADQHLDLTAEKRGKLEVLLAASMAEKAGADLHAMRKSMDQLMMPRMKTKIDPLLSKKQLAYWKLRNSRHYRGRKPDDKDKEGFLSLRSAARLAVRIESLGDIDERTKRYLLIAGKGSFMHHSEVIPFWHQILHLRKQAQLKRLKAGAVPGSDAAPVGPEKGFAPDMVEIPYHLAVNVAYHKIMLETVERVLSGEALARYNKEAEERQAYREKAVRDLVLFGVEVSLPLQGKQREKVASVLAEIPVPLHENLVLTLVFKALVARSEEFGLSEEQDERWGSVHDRIPIRVK